MAFNELLAERIRISLKLFPDVFTEKRMFGGLSFLFEGKMTIGIVKDKLAVRIIEKKVNDILKKEYVQPMDFTKKPMKEFVYVLEEGFNTEEKLLEWIELGVEHAKSKLK